MPTYDFECEKCAYYTEITQRMDEPSEYECPHCGEETLIKVFINPPAMFVRGSPNTIGQLADRRRAAGFPARQEKAARCLCQPTAVCNGASSSPTSRDTHTTGPE